VSSAASKMSGSLRRFALCRAFVCKLLGTKKIDGVKLALFVIHQRKDN